MAGLDDKTPLPARLDSYNAYFPPAPVVFKGEDGPITYHLAFRFYQYEKNPAQLLASSAGWYEGVVDFDGVKKRIQLIDGNVNGTFNDVAPDPYDSDRVQIEGDKTGERFLGKMVEVDGKFFQIEAARDGAFVKVQKAENVMLGQVRVPENISEFAAFGENGHFVRKPVNGEFTLPAGQYRIFHWTINRKDEKGAAWTLSGYNFPQTAGFEVAADKTAVLEIGEPVQAVLKATRERQPPGRLQPPLRGPAKRSHRDAARRAAPARAEIDAGQRRRDVVLHEHVRVWVRRRLFALMAGAQKCAASVGWQCQNLQPLPGAGKSVDARSKKIIKHPMKMTRQFLLVLPLRCSWALARAPRYRNGCGPYSKSAGHRRQHQPRKKPTVPGRSRTPPAIPWPARRWSIGVTREIHSWQILWS